MSQWKRTESPKILIPLELREVSAPKAPVRTWEVQELRGGAMFMVRLDEAASRKLAGSGRRLTDAEAERAVCLSVEEALLSPPDKEPGMTYEIDVNASELEAAMEAAH
jgi:hypothetical protein